MRVRGKLRPKSEKKNPWSVPLGKSPVGGERQRMCLNKLQWKDMQCKGTEAHGFDDKHSLKCFMLDQI